MSIIWNRPEMPIIGTLYSLTILLKKKDNQSFLSQCAKFTSEKKNPQQTTKFAHALNPITTGQNYNYNYNSKSYLLFFSVYCRKV